MSVPVEGVYAVMEVASNLNGPKLKDDVAKIRAAKRLPESPEAFVKESSPVIVRSWHLHGQETSIFPVLSYCFGYSGSSVESLRDELQSLDAPAGEEPVPLPQRLDTLVVLSRGCVVNARPQRPQQYLAFPDSDTERKSVPLDPVNVPGEALMLFYLLTCQLLAEARVLPINLVS